jgi:membrane fusion protein, type I secretion system
MTVNAALAPPPIVTDWRKPVVKAYLVILMAFGGVGGWAAIAKLDSAAIAPGSVAAQSNKKTVQHFDGGIVREILTRDGDEVHEGQVLLRLDDSDARSKILQLEQEARGLESDAQSSRQQVATIDQELPGLRELLKKGLVPLTRVTTLEREKYRLEAVADRALSDLAKLKEMHRVADDALRRTEIRAPRTGIVQGSKIFTIGAVIRPGDTVLEIAPLNEEMVVRIQISPMDMNVVSEGLPAEIRFPTFHSHRVPIMLGRLRSISYDKVTDPRNPQNSYFQGEVVADAGSIPAEIKTALKAGMPAEAVINTGERTPLDYMLSPLFDRLRKGMREQ